MLSFDAFGKSLQLIRSYPILLGILLIVFVTVDWVVGFAPGPAGTATAGLVYLVIFSFVISLFALQNGILTEGSVTKEVALRHFASAALLMLYVVVAAVLFLSAVVLALDMFGIDTVRLAETGLAVWVVSVLLNWVLLRASTHIPVSHAQKPLRTSLIEGWRMSRRFNREMILISIVLSCLFTGLVMIQNDTMGQVISVVLSLIVLLFTASFLVMAARRLHVDTDKPA